MIAAPGRPRRQFRGSDAGIGRCGCGPARISSPLRRGNRRIGGTRSRAGAHWFPVLRSTLAIAPSGDLSRSAGSPFLSGTRNIGFGAPSIRISAAAPMASLDRFCRFGRLGRSKRDAQRAFSSRSVFVARPRHDLRSGEWAEPGYRVSKNRPL